MTQLAFNQRVLVLGPTGTGKSVLLDVLFDQFAGGPQRVLVDTKREYSWPDVKAVSSVAAIDWREPVIHYQDAGGGPAEFGELFAACHVRRRILVRCDELADVCDYKPDRTPASFNEYVSKGRALGQGLLAGSQRPFEIPMRARSESDHVFIMVPGFTLSQDMVAAGQAIGMEARDLRGTLNEGLAQLGPHAFLHFERATRTLQWHPPLRDDERAGVQTMKPTLY